jgi:hypothetical protein
MYARDTACAQWFSYCRYGFVLRKRETLLRCRPIDRKRRRRKSCAADYYRSDQSYSCAYPTLPLNEITEHSIVVSADTTIPSRTSARMAHGGSGHAGTVDHDHTRPATHTGLRDHAVGLISWRERHCLCGGSERQPEQSKRYCFDHSFLLVVQNFLGGLLGSPLPGVAQDRKYVCRHNSDDDQPGPCQAMAISLDPATAGPGVS